MTFRTVGDKQNPVALLIHAMFIDDSMFEKLIPYLKSKYYIILPILDGHDRKSDQEFISVSEESAQIIEYIKKEKIDKLELLLGNSLGAIIAFDLFQRNEIDIKNVYLDGAPFVQLSKLRMKIMEFIFYRISIQSFRNPNKKNILDKLSPGLSGQMKKICGKMSKKTIHNLTLACYTYQLPDCIELSDNQVITFLYGTKERASMCIPTIKKYKNCRLLIKDGYHHCEFLKQEPEKYAAMLMQD